MIIRLANFETDALGIHEGALDFVSRMDYMDFIPEDIADIVARNVTADFVEVSVAEHDGKIVGALGMAYLPFLWNPKLISAEELFFWTAESAPNTTALRLIRFTVNQIKSRGKTLATFRRLFTSPDGLDRVYRKLGLPPVEVTHMGVL